MNDSSYVLLHLKFNYIFFNNKKNFIDKWCLNEKPLFFEYIYDQKNLSIYHFGTIALYWKVKMKYYDLDIRFGNNYNNNYKRSPAKQTKNLFL